MPTVRECLSRAEDFEALARIADSEDKRLSYLASAAQCRRLAARPRRDFRPERRRASSSAQADAHAGGMT
jgi:hypothetical protein